MTKYKIFGAAVILSMAIAAPASAWRAISEPSAREAMDPNFSIYSNDGPTLGSSRDATASTTPSVKSHRANRAPRY